MTRGSPPLGPAEVASSGEATAPAASVASCSELLPFRPPLRAEERWQGVVPHARLATLLADFVASSWPDGLGKCPEVGTGHDCRRLHKTPFYFMHLWNSPNLSHLCSGCGKVAGMITRVNLALQTACEAHGNGSCLSRVRFLEPDWNPCNSPSVKMRFHAQ